jgi:hypothetical protein
MALPKKGRDVLICLVGATGIEPVASSVSARAGAVIYPDGCLSGLLRVIVCVGLVWFLRVSVGRSSPRILPGAISGP